MSRPSLNNFKRWGRQPSPDSQARIRQEETELKEYLEKLNANRKEKQEEGPISGVTEEHQMSCEALTAKVEKMDEILDQHNIVVVKSVDTIKCYTNSITSFEDPNEVTDASVFWLPEVNDGDNTKFEEFFASESELSLYHSGESSVRVSYENILQKKVKATRENKTVPSEELFCFKEPINYYEMDKAEIEEQMKADNISEEKIKEYDRMCNEDNLNMLIVAEGGNSYEFAKSNEVVIDMSEFVPEEEKLENARENALLGKLSISSSCLSLVQSPVEDDSILKSIFDAEERKFFNADDKKKKDDDDNNDDGEKLETIDTSDENYSIPYSASETSTCVVVEHKFMPLNDLISLPIPFVYTEKKLTEEMKTQLSDGPSQTKSDDNDDFDFIFDTTIDSVTELELDDELGKSLPLIRYAQQQNRLVDKIIAGVLNGKEILEGIGKISPDYTKWPQDKIDANNGLPLLEVRILYYMIHFYCIRLKLDDTYNMQGYLLEGAYPIRMFLERGIPEDEAESVTQPISPEMLTKLDEMVLEYAVEMKEQDDEGDLFNELTTFYMLNSYYRSLAIRYKSKECYMKQCFAVAVFELYLAHKPEGQISYEHFFAWLVENEHLVVAIDADYRDEQLKGNIELFQSDDIKRFVNKSVYEFFNYHKKLPPADRLAVREDIEYPSVPAEELYGQRQEGSCPVTGCSHLIETNNYLAHFLEEHTISIEEIWLGQCGIFFFNPILYPDCPNTFCLGLIALNLGRRQLKNQNEGLSIGCDDLKSNYPIALMYSKLLSDSAGDRHVQYHFWLMTINLPDHINIEAVMSVYPLNMSQVKTLKLPIIQQKDFKDILHLKAENPHGLFDIKFKEMKYLTDGFEQFICLDYKVIIIDNKKPGVTVEDDLDDNFEDIVEMNLDNSQEKLEGSAENRGSSSSIPMTPSSSVSSLLSNSSLE